MEHTGGDKINDYYNKQSAVNLQFLLIIDNTLLLNDK